MSDFLPMEQRAFKNALIVAYFCNAYGHNQGVCETRLVDTNKITLLLKNINKRLSNRTARIRHQCWKTTFLNCNSSLINTSVEKMKNI